jgi:hypothetical protein
VEAFATGIFDKVSTAIVMGEYSVELCDDVRTCVTDDYRFSTPGQRLPMLLYSCSFVIIAAYEGDRIACVMCWRHPLEFKVPTDELVGTAFNTTGYHLMSSAWLPR